MFVLDASLTIAWLVREEAAPEADAVLEMLVEQPASVPELWHLEVANVLLMAMRRKRISSEVLDILLKRLQVLPIETVHMARDFRVDDILALAQRERLTVYDAAYLQLALQLGLPLATLDGNLRAAAARNGVAVLPD